MVPTTSTDSAAILHSQRDAEVGVGPDVVADGMAGPLGRQDEVHTEAAASLRDADERTEEVGQLGRERGELVDHHHQPGQGLAVRELPVGGQVADTDLAQQRSRRRSSALEAPQRPLGELVVEVGDDADDVGQVGAGVEGAPALVVDEEEGQVLRAEPSASADHERPQQLALPRSRGSCHQCMGAVAHEVELHGAVDGQADDGLRRAAAPGPPRGRHLSLRQRPRTGQSDEVDRVGEPAGAVEHLRVVVARDVPSGRHRHVGRESGDHDVFDLSGRARRAPTPDRRGRPRRRRCTRAGARPPRGRRRRRGRAGGHPPASRAGPHLQGAWVVGDDERGGSDLGTVVVGEIEMRKPRQPRPAPVLAVVGTGGISARIGDDGQVRRPDIDG